MKKIIILGLGHLSNGEITIAMETLHQGNKKDFEILFVSHPDGSKYIESMGFAALGLCGDNPEENKKQFEDLIQEWKPELILCADVYTMDFSASWSGIDFGYLKTIGIPLGSMDTFEWESTQFQWDFLGRKPLQVKDHLIRECDFLVRPCPLNKPESSTDTIGICSLFNTTTLNTTSTRDQWKEHFGIPDHHKVVFTVNSHWEYVGTTKLPRIKNLITWMPNIQYHYLKATKIPLTILHVSPKRWEFPVDEPVQYLHFKEMPSSLYKECIYFSDLFYSTNATSITLSTAVAYGTPSILFQNHKIMDFSKMESILHKMPGWYKEMADEVKIAEVFSMFPWGWYAFLKPVFENNPYTKCFSTTPIMIPGKAMKQLKTFLTNDTQIAELKENQRAYLQSIKQLEPIGEFFNRLSF